MIKKIEPVYCIKQFEELNVCLFLKGKTYNVIEVNEYTIAIVGEKDRTLSFNIRSPFNKYTTPNHFITIREYRKQKLEKLNESR